MDRDQLLRCGVDLCRAMGGSMSSEKIRRVEWWSRQKSALETAAQSADSFGSLVSIMADKLQIDVTTVDGGCDLADLAARVTDVPAFIRYLERESLFVVAIAQAEASERRAKREAQGVDLVAQYGAPNLQPQD